MPAPVSARAAAMTAESVADTAVARRCVGVVGVGHMGHTFALNLIADGHQVAGSPDAGLETSLDLSDRPNRS
jgi:hypothetical protein